MAIRDEEMKEQLLFYIDRFMIDSLHFFVAKAEQNVSTRDIYVLLKESDLLILRKLVNPAMI